MTDARSVDTPLQQAMRDALGVGAPPVRRDPALRREVLARLEGAFDEANRQWLNAREEPLWVDRVPLSSVLACERHFVLERGIPFSYTIPRARAQVAGEMLRRWAFRDPREQEAADLVSAVHELLDDLATSETSLGAFVAQLSPGGRSEMAAAVLDVVEAFGEAWPADYRPQNLQALSRLRVNLLNRHLVLSYTVGFRLGQPSAASGELMTSVVLFDMRPGVAYEEEERQNRWYAALVDLLKSGVVTKRVVTWYAESQEAVAEDITEDHLEAASRRVVGAVQRMIELERGDRQPNVLPGWRCKFCVGVDDCEPGQLYLRRTGHEVDLLGR